MIGFIKKHKEAIASFVFYLGMTASICVILYTLIWLSKTSRARDIEKNVMVELVDRENRDSMSAFMSIIVEANQTLVNNPRDCRWLVLTEIAQPCYVSRKLDGSVSYEKPTNQKILIWIPVDSVTWKATNLGESIPQISPLYIGNNIYNGDISRLKTRIIDKKDRGF